MSDGFDKRQAEEFIQSKLAEVMRVINDEIIPQARKHQIEFSFMGMQYHLYPRYSPDTMQVWSKERETWDTVPRPPAKEGLLVADEEWDSSTFGCSGRYWAWYGEQWPEGED